MLFSKTSLRATIKTRFVLFRRTAFLETTFPVTTAYLGDSDFWNLTIYKGVIIFCFGAPFLKENRWDCLNMVMQGGFKKIIQGMELVFFYL